MFLPTNITLKFGDSGDFVSELQRRLSVVKCFDETAINGFFDGVTVNSVTQFQTMSGIQADGVAGPETLRRLNGAIAGDFAGSTPDEAEAKRRAEEAQALLLQQRQLAQLEEQAMLQRQQEELARQQQAQQQSAAIPEAYVAPQQPAQLQPFAPPSAQPSIAPQVLVAEQLQQGVQGLGMQQQPAQSARPAAPTAGDMLAQMLLATSPSQAPAPTQSTLQPQTPAPQAYAVPVQAAAIAVAVSQQKVAPTTPDASPTPAQTSPEQPRGIVGRAVNYANQVVQKLAGYFEEKLPSNVINEVKEIGLTMAKSGVKEAAIPAGMEPQRATEGPARPQQPTIQRS